LSCSSPTVWYEPPHHRCNRDEATRSSIWTLTCFVELRPAPSLVLPLHCTLNLITTNLPPTIVARYPWPSLTSVLHRLPLAILSSIGGINVRLRQLNSSDTVQSQHYNGLTYHSSFDRTTGQSLHLARIAVIPRWSWRLDPAILWKRWTTPSWWLRRRWQSEWTTAWIEQHNGW